MKINLKKIVTSINKAKKIALFTHFFPDCDAFGSVFALYYALSKKGKSVSIFSKDEFPFSDKDLFDASVLRNDECNQEEFDLLISCDVSTEKLLGAYGKVFKSKENTIWIDHHKNSEQLGKLNYVDSEKSSCCELVFDVLKLMKIKITPQIASMLYVGLSSDTNSFVNTNSNANSFRVALELVEAGADIKFLNEQLYRMQTQKAIEFKKYLWNNYQVQGDVAYCLVSFETLKKLKGEKRDCDGFSNSLVSIQGINYSFSIVEVAQGYFSVSMRSKSGYDVRSKAVKIGGGGHICAAGARFEAENINQARDKVLVAITEGC